MSIKVNGKPVYFIMYNKDASMKRPGYVTYNGTNIFTFYKETQATLDEYVESGYVGGEHSIELTKLKTGGAQYSYSKALGDVDK